MSNNPHIPFVKLRAELLIDTRSTLGEGVIWNHITKKLLWVDIDEGLLHTYDPALECMSTAAFKQKVSMVAIADQDHLILAFHDGLYNYETSTGRLQALAHNPENQTTTNRFNDGKCDAMGRLWLGTMGHKQSAALYCVDHEHQIQTMLTGITTSNGIAWSPDQQDMYYIDSDTSKVVAYAFEPRTGRISNPRDVISIPEVMGIPDGSAIDAEGMIWIALWGGYCVTRWNPVNGALLATVAVPSKNVTSCTFGGEQMDQLYITTARTQTSAAELKLNPYSGGIFVLTPGVKGKLTNLFQSKYNLNKHK
ncbi:SMP-30/gluconolactonase/LRE family protein [Pedobacter sp. MC2016-24]|uniref:SMP-30/gluconolactonase/LRE family protein n=1 Tax=Pedobacter sp. MC2016-24 TaxID=2780090 RepID=UPI00187F6C76|nr:SMP-30/gluconolactonase/LRE family protein [Pedobacter sp. MC2016-24]MBE9598079.1 SMP-30/gluconolactonase/LRE family protein [Pedobacter sp. MC2016-24]